MCYKSFISCSLTFSAIFITAWDNLYFFSQVNGKSMQPVINPGKKKKDTSDFVFILRPFDLKTLFRRPLVEDMIKRGDVISIRSPKNTRECFLKRVIGLPGDIVKTINYKTEYVCVPEGHCWIEGDNYERSYDSNTFGCVSMGLVLGHAKYIIYPFERINKLDSVLPEHRELKTIPNDILCESNSEKNYLIDFKPKKKDENKNLFLNNVYWDNDMGANEFDINDEDNK